MKTQRNKQCFTAKMNNKFLRDIYHQEPIKYKPRLTIKKTLWKFTKNTLQKVNKLQKNTLI